MGEEVECPNILSHEEKFRTRVRRSNRKEVYYGATPCY